MNNRNYSIAIVDDHLLFSHAIRDLIDKEEKYSVDLVASGAEEFIQQSEVLQDDLDLVILDINMPKMNGIELAGWIAKNKPSVQVLALSMLQDENSIIKVLKAGAKGYLLKDSHPKVLLSAIDSVLQNGYYSNEISSKALLNSLNKSDIKFSTKELRLLKLVCTELTYKEIADQMCLSPKTIDGYRENLFQKLKVRSRIGLVIYSIKNKIYKVVD